MTDDAVCRYIERRLADELLPAMARVAEEAMAFRTGRPAVIVDEIARATGIADSNYIWLAISRLRSERARRGG
jgi:hypothetical protein